MVWGVLLLSFATLAVANDLRLVEAVRHRDRETVRALLKQGVDVNAPQSNGTTALHWAAQWDDLETARLLIDAGARVNAADEYGVTPLSLACTNGSAAMVETLLAAGADPNAALRTGETPLMTAARTGRVEPVKLLLARGAYVNAKETTQGQTALMWAAAESHWEVARTLIEYGADPNARSAAGFTPLLFAARNADVRTPEVLLAAGAGVNQAASNGADPLLVATVRGHVALARFLLEHGANVNANGAGYSPLHWAVGNWESGLTGTAGGISVTDNEWSGISGLQGSAKTEMIELLLADGADPNARATRNVRRFRGGGGPNTAGATPFLIAAAAADLALMRLLLERGVDPRVATNANVTPLVAAAGLNRIEDSHISEAQALGVVKFLVEELGADVNAATKTGDTALHAAATLAYDQMVQYLVDKGANLNAKNEMGWSPLTIADGVYLNATLRVRESTAALLRKLGAPEYTVDCAREIEWRSIEQETLMSGACARQLLGSNPAAEK